jgi:hypothetical protein
LLLRLYHQSWDFKLFQYFGGNTSYQWARGRQSRPIGCSAGLPGALSALTMTCHHDEAGSMFSPGMLNHVDRNTWLGRGSYRYTTGFQFGGKLSQVLSRVT